MQIRRAPIDDRKVHFAAMQPFDEMAAVAFDDPQADPWKGFDASTGEARRKHAAHGRNQPQHHPSGRLPSRRLDIVADLVDLPDDAGGPFEQQAAGIGQHHAAAVAGKQLGAQFMLEQLDLAAERRLRHPQRIGGLAEAAKLRHATERPELTEIHTCQSWNAGPYAITIKHREFTVVSQLKAVKQLNQRTPTNGEFR